MPRVASLLTASLLAAPLLAGAIAAVWLLAAWWLASSWPESGGAIETCGLLGWLIRPRDKTPKRKSKASSDPAPVRPAAADREIDSTDGEALAGQMLDQERFSLLLRPQIVTNLSEDHYRRAMEDLERTMALVPDGEVVLGQTDESMMDYLSDRNDHRASPGRVVTVERVFLDRFPVTNQQYYEFVAAGGYQQVTLWDPSILTAVLEMVDRTETPGPRYWENGCYLPGQQDHPVIGISWYEACAYARWIGKRLPSDAEWVKAGSWPVTLSPTNRTQRRYPWGDSMDRKRTNLWGAGPEEIVPVDRFAEGVSVGGVYQLIGNVWEWMSAGYRPPEYLADEIVLPGPMKSIRGGAFDTYFDNQATCQFQSAENPLGRKHNIGFRCAVAVRDLVLARRDSPNEATSDEPTSAGESSDQPSAATPEGVPPVTVDVTVEPDTPRAEEVHA